MAFGVESKMKHANMIIQIILVVFPVYFLGWTTGFAITAFGLGLQKYGVEFITGGSLLTTTEEGWEQIWKMRYRFAIAKVDKLTVAEV